MWNRCRGNTISLPETSLTWSISKRCWVGTASISFEKLKLKMVQTVDDMLAYDIPELLKNFRNPYE
jgi:hypothetical protein